MQPGPWLDQGLLDTHRTPERESFSRRHIFHSTTPSCLKRPLSGHSREPASSHLYTQAVCGSLEGCEAKFHLHFLKFARKWMKN